MVVTFANTHAYPGCRAVVRDGGNEGECLAEFSDGAVAQASSRREGEGLALTVASYVTRRGTRIQGKTWLLLPDGTGGARVERRLPNGA